jgi:creatinine amidohydrolase
LRRPLAGFCSGVDSRRVETLLAVMRDVVASLDRSGFQRILIVNGHGGNAPVGALAQELMAERPHLSVRFHNWWAAPKTFAKVRAIDAEGTHAGWMENFPWTRLDHAPAPDGRKPVVDVEALKTAVPGPGRAMLGDGNLGGPWQKDDATMQELWEVGVAETRAALEGPWPSRS